MKFNISTDSVSGKKNIIIKKTITEPLLMNVRKLANKKNVYILVKINWKHSFNSQTV